MDKEDNKHKIVSSDLVLLVDDYLDGNLTPESKEKLETMLESDESAQDYFVDRIRFHGEMLESQQPIRVEMVQKRQVIFEYEKGIPKVTTREAKAARVGNPKRENFVELVPENPSVKRALVAGGILLVLLSAGLVWLTKWVPEMVMLEAPFE